jgi:hypothetical protein
MKDLKQLHHEFTLASAAFRAAAIAQGFIRTDIGEDRDRIWWLRRADHDKVHEMLINNQDPEEYCLDLAFENEAFFEY